MDGDRVNLAFGASATPTRELASPPPLGQQQQTQQQMQQMQQQQHPQQHQQSQAQPTHAMEESTPTSRQASGGAMVWRSDDSPMLARQGQMTHHQHAHSAASSLGRDLSLDSMQGGGSGTPQFAWGVSLAETGAPQLRRQALGHSAATSLHRELSLDAAGSSTPLPSGYAAHPGGGLHPALSRHAMLGGSNSAASSIGRDPSIGRDLSMESAGSWGAPPSASRGPSLMRPTVGGNFASNSAASSIGRDLSTDSYSGEAPRAGSLGVGPPPLIGRWETPPRDCNVLDQAPRVSAQQAAARAAADAQARRGSYFNGLYFNGAQQVENDEMISYRQHQQQQPSSPMQQQQQQQLQQLQQQYQQQQQQQHSGYVTPPSAPLQMPPASLMMLSGAIPLSEYANATQTEASGTAPYYPSANNFSATQQLQQGGFQQQFAPAFNNAQNMQQQQQQPPQQQAPAFEQQNASSYDATVYDPAVFNPNAAFAPAFTGGFNPAFNPALFNPAQTLPNYLPFAPTPVYPAAPAAASLQRPPPSNSPPPPPVQRAVSLPQQQQAAAPSSQQASAAPTRPIISAPKKACIGCNKLKVRCDDVRPCTHCTKLGRTCVDRTEEELEQAMLQRKRKSAQTKERNQFVKAQQQAQVIAAVSVPYGVQTVVYPQTFPSPPLPLPLPPQQQQQQPFGALTSTLYNAASDLISQQLFSRSLLSEIAHFNFRDLLLELHLSLSKLPSDVSAKMDFATKFHLSIMHFADTLTESDFLLFLTDGLTPQMIADTHFATSPLAEWTNLTTRPLHRVFPARAFGAERGNLMQPAPSGPRPEEVIAFEDANSPAQLRAVWLPEAIVALERWKRTGYQHVREDDRDQMLNVLAQVAEEQAAEEVTSLSDHLDLLQLSTPKIGQMPRNETDGDTNTHALWCGLGASRQWQETVSKRQRMGGNPTESPYAVDSASTGSGSSTDTIACVCERSVALPMLVTVNAAFERLFGFTQAEVSAFVAAEGVAFMLRRLAPPSAWPDLQRAQLQAWKLVADLTNGFAKNLGNKLQAAAAASAVDPSSSLSAAAGVAMQDQRPTPPSPPQPPPQSEDPSAYQLSTLLVTKFGQILPCRSVKAVVRGEHSAQLGFCHEWWLEPTPQPQYHEQQ